MTTQLALWGPEPCHDSTAPAPTSRRSPRTTGADRLRELRERRIEPEAGRAAGSWRRWTPGGDDIRITTLTPPARYL
ncbi:hypothetical protein AB0953_16660 [Streptomyces sp. NPDC046866]|uniref:hypothetical protein n=1 Tax=Streptomyces sp. NPDC046866 TaxID=3154921 RepID=UPI0034562ECD